MLNKLGIEENYFNIIKAIYGKSTANTMLNSGRWKAFPVRSGTEQGTFTPSIKYSTRRSIQRD